MMRLMRILLVAAGLLLAAGALAPQAAGQEATPTPDVNATPPGAEESVDGSDFSGSGAENTWSTFAIIVGVLTGIVLVVVLARRPPRQT